MTSAATLELDPGVLQGFVQPVSLGLQGLMALLGALFWFHPAVARKLMLAAVLTVGLLAASASAISPPRIAFTDTKLKNGLRVIIAEDHAAPVFSIAVVYDVGSRDERTGRTGFAHLFEHMMFKGSANVGPGEHFYAIFSNGGSATLTPPKVTVGIAVSNTVSPPDA